MKNITQQITNLPIENQEAPNVIHYQPGGYYKIHQDWFSDDAYLDIMNRKAGQRIYTVMFYLNDNYIGGDTYFPQLNLSIRGETGKIITWRNVDENINGLYEVEHTGQDVISGDKWICTIWVRKNKFF